MPTVKKRGQLSYEYVVIVGTLLVILLPFFYLLFDVMHRQLNDYYGGIAVNTIADITKTASNLFRGSTVEAVVRLPKNLQEITSIGGKYVTFRFTNGNDIMAIGGGYSLFGTVSLEGGRRTVRATDIVDGLVTISFGGPVIACLTIVDHPISKQDCIDQIEGRELLAINPSDRLMIVGSGMSGNTLVHLQKWEKVSGSYQWSEPNNPHDNAVIYTNSEDEAPLADVMEFEEPTYGGGDWRTYVEEDGYLSNYLYFKIGGGGGKGDDDDD